MAAPHWCMGDAVAAAHIAGCKLARFSSPQWPLHLRCRNWTDLDRQFRHVRICLRRHDGRQGCEEQRFGLFQRCVSATPIKKLERLLDSRRTGLFYSCSSGVLIALVSQEGIRCAAPLHRHKASPELPPQLSAVNPSLTCHWALQCKAWEGGGG